MLISTDDLRTWLGLKDGDYTANAKLLALAQAIQDFVETVTNRKLEAKRYYTDPMYCYLDGNGLPYIYLPQYPISHVNEVKIDADRVFGSGTEIGTNDIFFYPSGKVVSEGGYFNRGRRNVRIDYNAGYAPIIGGTHNAAVSTYPIPYDLKQVMVEMVTQSFKEGITAVHTVQGQEFSRFVQLLSGNSMWAKTLSTYTKYDVGLGDREE